MGKRVWDNRKLGGRIEKMIALSEDQKRALEGLLEWQRRPKKQFISLGGYAGTGKTSLIAELRRKLPKKIKIAFASFTGKAARVLRGKLVEGKAIYEKDSCGTIHSLIYSPIVNDKEEIVGWERKEEVEADLIVIDEASMVDESIWTDLCGYGKPIVAVGDHGQLPPIRGSFNLMAKPDLLLEKIHRQARGNPIIEVSVWARKTGKIPVARYGDLVRKIRREEGGEEIEEILKNYNEEWMILCGYNKSRIRLNNIIRQYQEKNPFGPVGRDRVICLRNNHSKMIFNGMLGTLIEIEDEGEFYRGKIAMDGEEDEYEGLILKEQFGREGAINFSEQRYKSLKADLFDWGYVLTVHKAQGSQAKRVLLFEERFSQMDEDEWRKWLYTGVSRAEEELLVVG